VHNIKFISLIYSAILVNILFMAIVSGCLSSKTPSEKAKHVDISVQQGKEMIVKQELFCCEQERLPTAYIYHDYSCK
jgi:hypothetical protein